MATYTFFPNHLQCQLLLTASWNEPRGPINKHLRKDLEEIPEGLITDSDSHMQYKTCKVAEYVCRRLVGRLERIKPKQYQILVDKNFVYIWRTYWL
jgi:hypothetical protein